ncbi:MAG: sugar ABC transporter substrate-binding protein [Deltaproteobacteria bacterium]|nr:sugar ABC transporter substrate-binding protein [Deltaproteobacteria bacterium]
MTRLRRAVHSPAALALLLTFAAGCRQTDPNAVELRFWAMGREGEVVQSLLPGFAADHPGVRVRVQQVPWSAAHEKLLTAFVGGALPDVYQAGSTWIPELVALGAAAPLDARLAAAARADYFPGLLDANLVDGRLWGVPWYVDTRLLFYRSDALRAAGWPTPPGDWDGWRAALERIKAQVGPSRYAILLPVSEWQPPVILALQRGAALLRDDDTHGNFQSAEFRAAFAFYLEFFRRGLAPASAEGQIANLYQDFADGFFNATITGPWNLGEFATRLPADRQDDWATAPMPAPSPDTPGVSIAGGSSLAINAASPHAELAWQLVDYLTAPERQLEFYRLTGDLPARRSAWAAGALADQPHVQAFWQQLQHVRTPPKIPEWERIATTIARYAEAAVRGDLTTDEALIGLDRDVDRILEKRRWLKQQRSAVSYQPAATPLADSRWLMADGFATT